MSRVGIVIGIVFALLVGGLVYFFVQNFERVEEKEWVGPRPEAYQNPTLAASRFLKAMGIPTREIASLEQLDTLPAKDEVLLIFTERRTMSEERVQSLLDWVESGGHLIVRAREFEWEDGEGWVQPQPDSLLEALDLIPVDLNNSTDIEYYNRFSDPAEVPLADDGGVLSVSINRLVTFPTTQGNDLLVVSELGNHLVHRRHGDGAVTVLPDLEMIDNWDIGEIDNAEFLFHLVHLEHTPASVWIVYFDEMPPLLTWLWENAQPVMITLIMLFVMWLLAATRRFGPLEPVAPLTRRRLLEHIEAAGHFLWRHERHGELVENVRDALNARMCRLHPGWAELSLDERQAHLATLTELSPAELHELLHRRDYRHPQDFTRLVKTLETIRKQL